MNNAAQLLKPLAELMQEEHSAPYPHRDIARERETLHVNDALSLDALSQFGWGGMRDLRLGARILIVGEGNGDATLFLAEQARDTAIELVAIETSKAAIDDSKARLAQRGLTNVVHHHCSLLTLPQANLGEFDIIECSHVLDHIEQPLEGLAALAAVLKDDGMMFLSVNATYGRLQVHMIQALLQYLVTDHMPRAMKIQIVREFLSAVPPDHWMGHDSADFIKEIEIADGSGIDALFLQPHNHTFAAAEVYQMLDQCGLALTSFMGPQRAAYNPYTHTPSPMLHDLLNAKPDYERTMIGDMMHGGIRAHQFYAAIQDKLPAQFAEDMVIVLAPSVSDTAALASLLTPETAALLPHLDSNRSIGALVETGVSRELLEQLYNALHAHQRAFLRHKDIAPTVNADAIQARLKSIPPITYQ